MDYPVIAKACMAHTCAALKLAKAYNIRRYVIQLPLQVSMEGKVHKLGDIIIVTQQEEHEDRQRCEEERE